MPKLLLLLPSSEVGGTERQAINLASAVKARGWNVLLVLPSTAEDSRILDWCKGESFQVELSASLLDLTHVRTTRDIMALKSLVRAERADVVNIHFGGTHMAFKDIVGIRLAQVKTCVATVNHCDSWRALGNRKRQMTRFAACLTSRVVVISEATRSRMLQTGMPSDKIRVVFPGTRRPQYIPVRGVARTRLDLPESAFVIACLSRLVASKGIADLIEAIARIDDPLGEIRLLIAGDGPDRFSLERAASTLLQDRVTFLGRVDDTTNLFSSADIFALPSYSEGFGLVFVEAAHFGLPSVGTTAGGIPDAVCNGLTGLLVAPGDRAELATAIATLWKQPDFRMRLGSAAKKRALSEFSEVRAADRYLEVFAELGVA